MRLNILGTSAGKPVPRPFCSCRVCQVALERGGRECRTRTTVQLYPLDSAEIEFRTPKYQVDLSPDYPHQLITQRIDPGGLEHLLVTHADADHLHLEYLDMRRTIRSPVEDLPVLTIYGNSLVEAAIQARLPDLERLRCRFVRVEDGETFRVGAFEVTAFVGMHPGPKCLHYAVDDGRHKVLLAWDGLWSEDVWRRLESWRFDAVVMECTHLGPSTADMTGHLTLAQFVRTRDRLLSRGIIDEATPVVAMHIGDNGGLTYSEAAEVGRQHGFVVSHDGMVLDL